MMKKYLVLGMMGAIALTFTACTSDDGADSLAKIDKQDVGKAVSTQFALNLSQANGTTRMTPDVVQLNAATSGDNAFRGMEAIYLVPMNFIQAKTDGAYGVTTSVNVDGTETTIQVKGPGQAFDNDLLGTAWSTNIYSLGNIAVNEITRNQSSKIYSMTLPVGTSNFLFYGKALHGDYSPRAYTSDNNAEKGYLNHNLKQTLAKAEDIEFKLQPITTNAATNEPRTFLLGILNDIEGAQYTDGEGAVHVWRELDRTDNNFITLRQAYDNLVTIRSGEVRSGSAEGIRATVQELYRTVLSQSRTGQTDEVKAMASAIRTVIEQYFYVYFKTGDATATSTEDFNGFSGAAVGPGTGDGQIDHYTDTDGNHEYTYKYYNAILKYRETDATKINFPMEQGLPAGAAQLTYSDSRRFFYIQTTTSVTTGSYGTNMYDICYPAELTYFANSGLRATEINKEVKDYPVTVGAWDNPNDPKWADWTLNYVTADTRAVAMKNNVNYGVAMLKTVVKNDKASLQDNRKSILADGITQDQTVALNDKSFIVTGILIGGQPNVAGWDFLPKADGTDDRDLVVYDRVLSKDGADGKYDFVTYPDEAYVKNDSKSYSFVTTTGTQPNYTLLLDNCVSGGATQVNDVAIAIELINNTGRDFYGRDNVIPAGGTFYLAGKLNLSDNRDASKQVDWTKYINTSITASPNTAYTTRIPAYGVDRIFIQDHTTVANLSFSDDALKHAYSTVPDLRSIQLLFGLSVDLEWLNGMEFNVEL